MYNDCDSVRMSLAAEFDKIWCLEYDEDCYNKPMVKINFSKYLNQILSNQYFPAFQAMAAKQLRNEEEWNQRSWALLQMFQYFNGAFAIEEFESNVRFIPDQKTRKMFGSFRMWIDLERLYLLCFLKMDRIEFQEDRIFFCLYRTMIFMHELLAEYQVSDFQIEFLNNLCRKIGEHTMGLEKCLPKYMGPMLKSIQELVPNFIQKQPLLDTKLRDEIRKISYRKIGREYDMMGDIEHRIQNNIQIQTRMGEMLQVERITESPQIHIMTKQIEYIYDPDAKIRRQFEEECRIRGEPVDEAKLADYYRKINEKKGKQKSSVSQENAYQSLMKTGHNPYDESNYAIYGETLGVDMNIKQELEKVDPLSEAEEEEHVENVMYYEPNYLQKIQKMELGEVAVTIKDLNNRTINNSKDNYHYNDNSTLLKNLKWKYEEGQETVDIEDISWEGGQPATSLRSINMKKNLENNALFLRNEQQDQERSMQILKRAFNDGFDSSVLSVFQKKKRHLFDYMEEQKKVSYVTRCVVDSDKIGSLRKVAQLHAINKKLNRLIKEGKVPNYYPRGIDEIRSLHVNTEYAVNRLEAAFDFLNQ